MGVERKLSGVFLLFFFQVNKRQTEPYKKRLKLFLCTSLGKSSRRLFTVKQPAYLWNIFSWLREKVRPHRVATSRLCNHIGSFWFIAAAYVCFKEQPKGPDSEALGSDRRPLTASGLYVAQHRESFVYPTPLDVVDLMYSHCVGPPPPPSLSFFSPRRRRRHGNATWASPPTRYLTLSRSETAAETRVRRSAESSEDKYWARQTSRETHVG